jgi:hypothetical protein
MNLPLYLALFFLMLLLMLLKRFTSRLNHLEMQKMTKEIQKYIC